MLIPLFEKILEVFISVTVISGNLYALIFCQSFAGGQVSGFIRKIFLHVSRRDFVAYPLARFVEAVLGRFIALRKAGFDAVPG